MTIQPFFCTAGFKRLSEIVKPGFICVFDFDGTLSAIVAHPTHARLTTNILQRINKLKIFVPIAIITGRSLADITPRLGFEPDFIIGNHGLEGLPGWEAQMPKYTQLCNVWYQTILAELQNDKSTDSAIWIENKGCSLSLHYRGARNERKSQEKLIRLLAKLTPAPKVLGGKCVFNLLPNETLDKGSAFLHLMKLSKASSAIYVGDDVTDEDVFNLRCSNVLSVKIGPPYQSAADFYLASQLDMYALLDDIIKRLQVLHSA